MRALSLTLEIGADGRWAPGIGDPTILGWVTVFAYFTAAYLCWTAARTAHAKAQGEVNAQTARDQRTISRFWMLSVAIMVLLGINKQLDLQSLFTEVARDLSRAQGWYEERRRYQVAFVAAIGVIGLIATSALAFALRRVLRRVMGGLLGLGLIVSFVVIRAASFHHIDILLMDLGPVRLNWIIELSGIGLIGYAAYRASRSAPAESPPVAQKKAA